MVSSSSQLLKMIGKTGLDRIGNWNRNEASTMQKETLGLKLGLRCGLGLELGLQLSWTMKEYKGLY